MNCQNTSYHSTFRRTFIITFVMALAAGSFLTAQESPGLKLVAGDGTPGFSDVDPVRFHKPIRLAPYGKNTILTADIFNHAIRSVTIDGIVRTIAGGPDKAGHRDGPASESSFDSPHGVAFDPSSGEILVAEAGNHTIRLLTPVKKDKPLHEREYTVSTLAGRPGEKGFKDGPAGEAYFNSPHALAFLPDKSIVVADIGNARIRLIKEGMVSTIAGTGESGQKDGDPLRSTFTYPMDLVIAGDRTILIADAGTDLIRKLLIGKEVSTLQLQSELHTPHGIAVDKNGTLYVADMKSHRVVAVNETGEVRPVCGTGESGSQTHELNKPAAVLVHDGHLWIADLENHQIKVIPLSD